MVDPRAWARPLRVDPVGPSTEVRPSVVAAPHPVRRRARRTRCPARTSGHLVGSLAAGVRAGARRVHRRLARAAAVSQPVASARPGAFVLAIDAAAATRGVRGSRRCGRRPPRCSTRHGICRGRAGRRRRSLAAPGPSPGSRRASPPASSSWPRRAARGPPRRPGCGSWSWVTGPRQPWRHALGVERARDVVGGVLTDPTRRGQPADIVAGVPTVAGVEATLAHVRRVCRADPVVVSPGRAFSGARRTPARLAAGGHRGRPRASSMSPTRPPRTALHADALGGATVLHVLPTRPVRRRPGCKSVVDRVLGAALLLVALLAGLACWCW